MKNELEDLLKEETSEVLESEFTRLIKFIDAAIVQGCSVDGQEKVNVLINNFLNMRNYLMSELTIKRTKRDVKNDVVLLFEKFVADHDLDLEALSEIKLKKKKTNQR